MSDVAIRMEGISKRYRIGKTLPRYGRLTESLWNAIQAPFRSLDETSDRSNGGHIWALNDVSLEIKQGEVVGIVGSNGAGKTTLLKVLSRITEPTEGIAEIRGSVGALLEVGTGFHPELTGRENIYLSGAILGMGRAEIKAKFDEIVSFADVHQFIDTPVKRYSTGMQVRLAFAVAAHLETDILLVDEVLAVGDVSFQQKSVRRMGDVAERGRTVLFVSHNVGAIQALCEKALLLSEGQVVFAGETSEVLLKYEAQISHMNETPLGDRDDRRGQGWCRLVHVAFEGNRGGQKRLFLSGETCRIVLGCESLRSASHMRFAIGLYDDFGRQLALLDSLVAGASFAVAAGYNEVRCVIPSLPLVAGPYRVNLAIMQGTDLVDHVTGSAEFSVGPGDFFGTGKQPDYGPFLMRHEWRSGTSIGVGQTKTLG